MHGPALPLSEKYVHFTVRTRETTPQYVTFDALRASDSETSFPGKRIREATANAVPPSG